MIFSKVDKKVLIIAVIAVVVILLVGLVVYKYVYNSANNVQNLTDGAQSDKTPTPDSTVNTPQVQIQAGGVQTQGGNGAGTLLVCSDKCGDGICQKTDPKCGNENNLNCVCPETPEECPQDCK